MAQRRVPQAMTPQADDDNDEDDLIVSGRPSIGLGGARQMQARTPVVIISNYLTLMLFRLDVCYVC